MPSRLVTKPNGLSHDDENDDSNMGYDNESECSRQVDSKTGAKKEVYQVPSQIVDVPCDDGEDGILFSCRCESARSVTTLLSCLRHVSLSNNKTSVLDSMAVSSRYRSAVDLDRSRGGTRNKTQHATVFATPSALTFHVHGTARQSQASVDMQSGLFSDYYVAEQRIPLEDASGTTEETTVHGGEFGINLTTVLECLHVLGAASLDRTKLCLSYDHLAAIFKIELFEEGVGGVGGVLSTCAIPGLSVPDDDESTTGSLTVAFRSTPIVARAIVKSVFLKDAIIELQNVPGAASCMIGMSPRNGLEFATVGHSSECHISLPYVGNSGVFVSLECKDSSSVSSQRTRAHQLPNKIHARSYPLHSVLSAMRGLEIASETCISMNGRGMVAIQHQVLDLVGKGSPNFVDYIMVCLLDETEDDEDDGTSNGASDEGAANPYCDNQQISGLSQKDPGAESSNAQYPSPLSSPLIKTNPLPKMDSSSSKGSTTESDDDIVKPTGAAFISDAGADKATMSSKSASDQRRKRRERLTGHHQTTRSHGLFASDSKKLAKRSPDQAPFSFLSDGDKDDTSNEEGDVSKSDDGSDTSFSVKLSSSTGKKKEEGSQDYGSLDVTATLPSTPRRLRRRNGKSLTNNNSESDNTPSSPELMYGDTLLQTSDEDRRAHLSLSRQRNRTVDLAERTGRSLSKRSGYDTDDDAEF